MMKVRWFALQYRRNSIPRIEFYSEFVISTLLFIDRHYHASMTAEEREKTQYDWTHGKVQIIAATIAFGMGIFSFISY